MAEIPFSFLECLEAIYRLARDGAAVSLYSLGKRLGLNKALVTEKVLGLPIRDARRAAVTSRAKRTAPPVLLSFNSLRSLSRWPTHFCLSQAARA